MAAKAALWMAGDSEWRTGWPMTAARRVAPVGQSGAPRWVTACLDHAGGAGLGHVGLVLAQRRGEGVVAVLVLQHVVEPVAVGGVQGRFDGGLAGQGDG